MSFGCTAVYIPDSESSGTFGPGSFFSLSVWSMLSSGSLSFREILLVKRHRVSGFTPGQSFISGLHFFFVSDFVFIVKAVFQSVWVCVCVGYGKITGAGQRGKYILF